MALNTSGLESELKSNRGNLSNVPAMASLSKSQALANFWGTGLGPGGASVIGAQAIPLMTPGFTSAYASLPAAEAIAAKQVAGSVNTGAISLILAGGVYGVHIAITSPGPSSLASELESVWKSQLPVEVAAKKEAKAYENFTKSLTAFGSGIPPSVPPQTGPIS